MWALGKTICEKTENQAFAEFKYLNCTVFHASEIHLYNLILMWEDMMMFIVYEILYIAWNFLNHLWSMIVEIFLITMYIYGHFERCCNSKLTTTVPYPTYILSGGGFIYSNNWPFVMWSVRCLTGAYKQVKTCDISHAFLINL